ncbi:nucleotidyltransferase domain-containing protein [Candidatus Desantisbacteria bacterium]|nr:nucleotidyltransferase domain-containing protein [Candidatus Desantisbacteria bacterium]MBI4846313.1 nucleotidyltransferase domain-containing protein [Candidatus Omnitrophota bacterium]
MITQEDKNKISELAKKYHISQVLLFGSALKNDSFNDIDLGIKGINPELFFKFYGELLFALSKSVDLVDLDIDNPFITFVQQEGIKIYG